MAVEKSEGPWWDVRWMPEGTLLVRDTPDGERLVGRVGRGYVELIGMRGPGKHRDGYCYINDTEYIPCLTPAGYAHPVTFSPARDDARVTGTFVSDTSKVRGGDGV